MKVKFDWQRHGTAYRLEYNGYRAAIDDWGYSITKDGQKVAWGTKTGKKAREEIENWMFLNATP